MVDISKTCEQCNSIFILPRKRHNAGQGRFCSRQCANLGQRKTKDNPPVSCSTCKTTFHISPQRRRRSKHGFFFCSRRCKDLASSLRPEYSIKEILPPHYGSNVSNYREVAFRHKPQKCERCGYEDIPEIVEVHHKDRDRTNNTIENLEVLCPTCHKAEHFTAKDGCYGVPGLTRTDFSGSSDRC